MQDTREKLLRYRRRRAAQEPAQTAGSINADSTLHTHRVSEARRDCDPDESGTDSRFGQAPQREDGSLDSDGTSSLDSTQTNSETEHTQHWSKKVLKLVLWLLLWGLFIELEFGVVFFILSLFYFIWASLRNSRRKPGEPSAYSVFNKDCEAIDGTLSGEQLDRELRYGPMSMKTK